MTSTQAVIVMAMMVMLCIFAGIYLFPTYGVITGVFGVLAIPPASMSAILAGSDYDEPVSLVAAAFFAGVATLFIILAFLFT